MGTTTCTSAAVWDMQAERWRKSLKAQGLSDNTLRGYLYTARRWSKWLETEDYDIEPDDVESFHIDDFIVDIIDKSSPANAAHHYRNLRVYITWLKKRKQITGANPFDETAAPKVPDKLTPLLSDEDHAAVLLACLGKDLQSLRDTAIILLFIDTGMRVSELHSLRADDIDFKTRRLLVRGKGKKLRWVQFGARTGLALAKYLKVRAKHPLADFSPALWLSRRTDKPLSINAIKKVLNRRGQQAGLADSLHAHRFRHDFSHRWQDAGGSEAGLMAIAGWDSERMPRHYGKIAKSIRALAEHERLSLADRLVA
jgi:site-specific recombinase XerD